MPALGLILVGAGSSRRMRGVHKVWAPIGEKPLLRYSLERLGPAADVTILVVRPDDVDKVYAHCRDTPNVVVVPGGPERQDSVENGIAALPESIEAIAVHDVARPFAPAELIQTGLDELRVADGAIPAIEPVDTLKAIDAEGY